jgi:HAD superfamily hydrolase (TIGR01509 family)
MIKVVIFDFDGVITDSEVLHLRAFNRVLARFNVEISTKDYYQKYLGLNDVDCYKTLIKNRILQTNERQIRGLVDQKNRIFEELARTEGATISGVHEFLQMLAQNKIPMAICSGALRTEIEMLLEEAGLRHFFTVIISAEQVKKGKPDPEGFLLTLERLNEGCENPVMGNECIVIEDSHWGLEAARAAGMHTIAVTNTYEAEQLSQAEKIVSRLDELTINELQQLCT